MGAFKASTGSPPLWAGVLGGVLTTWVTFTRCFLRIFLGASFVEALRGARALNAALSAITAAVAGVILNLAPWFGLQVLFREVRPHALSGAVLEAPVLSSLKVASFVATLAAAVEVFRFKVGVIPVLLACAGAGVLHHLATGAAPAIHR